MQPQILHIDIDAFFAAVEVLLNPDLKGKAVIVGGRPDERGVVCTASYEARRFGVHSGMALRTAFQKCPQGIFLRGRYHVYSEVSRQFFACLERFSPRVIAASLDEAYLDLRGSRYLASSVYELAERIKQEVEKTIGINVSVGLAATRMGAKLATEVAKPAGIFMVIKEDEINYQLALEKIPGIGPHTLLILHGLGVRRVNELKKKHLAIWKKLIGAHLCCRSLPLTAHEPQNRSFSRETTFPHDIGDVNMLMSHLAYLVDRLSVYLLQEKLYAGRVEVKVRFSDFSTFTKRLALDFPSFSFSELWKKSSLLLEALRTKKSLPLRLVGVKVENISPYRDLLPFISIRGEQLSRGVFAVKDKFGFSAIYTARELLLRQLYPKTDQGLVLKTASLTK